MGRKFGEFSLIKADRNGKFANIGKEETVKILIPKKFGGGCIKGKFDGTGLIKENGINYSIYELAGIWNSKEMYSFVESMGYDSPGRKPFIDTPYNNRVTEKIQNVGIAYTTYDKNHVRAEYPIKIVSEECNATYEECDNISLYDRRKGCAQWEWEKWQKIFGTSSYEETVAKAKNEEKYYSQEELERYCRKMIKEIKEIKETD